MSKAGALQQAKRVGLPVPGFFVVSHEIGDAKLEEIVAQQLASLKGTLFSVRSSAEDEDGTHQSFAGQFKTYLSVPTDEIVSAIRSCRDSGTDPQKNGYDTRMKHQFVDVIVQQMIDVAISGVAFSANPHGMLNEMVITVAYDAGTVVTGNVPTATYYYHTDDDTIRSDVPDNAPHLEHSEILTIIELIVSCQQQFGQYIDCEFAIAKKTKAVWLLQVRPITTIDTRDPVIFDSHNISESYPGIVLPLTQSFAEFAYTHIFRRFLERAIGQKSTRRYAHVIDHMVTALHGRMYYRSSNWFDVLQLLPFRSFMLRTWQKMVGVDLKQMTVTVSPLFRDQLRVIWATIFLSVTLPAKMRRLHHNFVLSEIDFQKRYTDDLSVKEYIRLFDWLTKKVLTNWDLTLANDLQAFAWTGLYERLTHTATDLRHTDTLPSMQAANEFSRLAQLFQQSEDKQSVLAMSAEQFEAYLAGHGDLANVLNEYIAWYGDRVPGELKLETKTFRTNPLLIVEQLASFQPTTTRKEPLEQQSLLLRYVRSKALEGVYNREQSRLDRSRIFGMVRLLMLGIGRRLQNEGALEVADDVFYLTLHDIRAYSAGMTFHEQVGQRKHDIAKQTSMHDYSRMVFQSHAIHLPEILSDHSVQSGRTDGLHGIGCSVGIVSGEAVVVHDLSEAKDIRGKIIIAETTDPGWVFVLSQAKAIVTEKGSLLSHTAIVSRELRVPAVVGVAHVTDYIHSGDMVTVNGLTGDIVVGKS